MGPTQQTVYRKFTAIFLTIFLFAMCSLAGQTEHFYYYRGERIILHEITQKKFVLIKTEDTLLFKHSFSDLENNTLIFHKVFLPIVPYNRNLSSDYCWCITDINEKDYNFQNYVYKSSSYCTSQGDTVMLSHLFYVKLKRAEDIGLLESLADSMEVSSVGHDIFMPLWYTLSCNQHSVGNALKIERLDYS